MYKEACSLREADKDADGMMEAAAEVMSKRDPNDMDLGYQLDQRILRSPCKGVSSLQVPKSLLALL